MSSLIYFKRVNLVSPYWRNDGLWKTALGFSLHNFLFLSERYVSSVQSSDTRKPGEQRHSFVVSYLEKSCGLSKESAKFKSRYVNVSSPERPDSVLGLFKKHGFTSEQITKVVVGYPAILNLSAETVLAPKFEYLQSILVGDKDIPRVVSGNPKLLGISLDNLIRGYEFFKTTLVNMNKERVARSFKRCLQFSRIILADLENTVVTKISILKRFGVPESSVAYFLEYSPNVFCYSALKFEDTIKKVLGMGFEPSNTRFIGAFKSVGQNHQSTWDNKIKVLKECGWSDSDFVSAFMKRPMLMCWSEKKLADGLDFFTNKMGISAADVANYPTILSFSLEKRIVPRCSVLLALTSQGVLQSDTKPVTLCLRVLLMIEKDFLAKYVNKYPDHVLELWNSFPR